MKSFLYKAAKAYYEGNPLISDSEFDMLAVKHNFKKVGYTITDGVPHTFPLTSLQKVFSLENTPVLSYVESPKLDGAAVSLLYIQGELVLALTRGDGKIGRDITDKMKYLVSNTIDIKGLVQIIGEVVAPKTISNARNYASGALNLKSLEEFRERDVCFVAYDAVPNRSPKWTEQMFVLERNDMRTVCHSNMDKYPQDGVVYRINNYDEFYNLGFTSHHPRGAFALKKQKAGGETTLLAVEWQVGKSGCVSPVAILEPVKIGDATVSRATLHNMQYINDLDLEIGCQVEVIRSGEIIPRIVRRV